jgi:hypothetical protein
MPQYSFRIIPTSHETQTEFCQVCWIDVLAAVDMMNKAFLAVTLCIQKSTDVSEEYIASIFRVEE